jgi:hypothetical protein
MYFPWRVRPPTEGERNVLFWIVVAIWAVRRFFSGYSE